MTNTPKCLGRLSQFFACVIGAGANNHFIRKSLNSFHRIVLTIFTISKVNTLYSTINHLLLLLKPEGFFRILYRKFTPSNILSLQFRPLLSFTYRPACSSDGPDRKCPGRIPTTNSRWNVGISLEGASKHAKHITNSFKLTARMSTMVL